MKILCWLFGHKENEDIKEIDFMFTRTKTAVLRGKKMGVVNINYKLKYCDRCGQLYLHKEIVEDFSR